jgi:uncharacterized protein (TIGR00369 family)
MNEKSLPYTRECFVCGAHNQHGLKLRFYRDGPDVVTEFTPQPEQAGFRGIVHGGIIATVLDEAMFWAAACAKGRFCLAAELSVRFLRKVMVGQKLRVVATMAEDRGRVWHSRAELRDGEGTVYARATCKQMPMTLDDMKLAAVDFLPAPGTIPAAELFPGAVTPAAG